MAKKVFYLDHTNRQKTCVSDEFKPIPGLNVNIEEVSKKKFVASNYTAAMVKDGAPVEFEIPEKKKKK